MLSTLKLYFVIFRKVYKEIRLYDNSPICSQKWMDAKKMHKRKIKLSCDYLFKRIVNSM